MFIRFCVGVVLFQGLVCGQSTATIQGTVTDATGSAVPGAGVTIRNQETGEERVTATDSSGIYLAPALNVGTYRVEVKAAGMAPIVANNLVLPVGSTVRQDFTLKVASSTETVEIQATAPVVEDSSVSVGSVIDQKTVQEIPLNGRHFVDLALLSAGTVTPPANGFLTAPLRGQGSFSFVSAGGREDTVNFMVNGINLNDPNQNQITFQPTINTVQEAKFDNSTFSAEYGRNSGTIVNIATRSGTNAWHGEAYDFLRNNDLDARNFSNPSGVAMSPFIRNQFGGDGGGAIKKDKTFFFLSYEGLRQRQAVPLSTLVLNDAQRAQAANSDATIQKLVQLLPAANSPGGFFVASATAPVNIEQGTVNFSHSFSDSNRVVMYYAIQRDQRNEPPSTDGNNIPGFGDQRNGQRQILTLNDYKVFTPTLVNEARLGYSRIHIVFAADNTVSAAGYGINSGVPASIGLPQISVAGAFSYGGIGGFPQGRGDYVGAASDTLSWVRGKHSLKVGGEFRRQDTDNFSSTPGTVSFPNIAAFLADQANSFTANSSNRSNRTYASSLGGFVQDAWRVTSTLTLQLGLRYDWYGTPTEAENRFVVFDPASDSLQHVGQAGGPANVYNQSALNFQPRVGFAWSPFEGGKTVIRGAYAIMTDQPTLGLVSGLVGNPPYALPVSFTPTASVPYVNFGNAYSVASGSIAPVSVAHNFKDAYVSQWNFNIQHQFGNDYGLMAGYFGSKGTHLNIERNYNQPVNGVKPYAALSAASPIDPGAALSNIFVYESDGNSSYNALWVTLKKNFSKNLQFNVDYTYSKSIDENSRSVQGLVIQNSYNIAGDRGLSDFDVRNRIVLSGVYSLPFKGNRFKEGWEMSLIEQSQSGNPVNLHIANTSYAGAAVLRPNVTGNVITGYSPATNGNATVVTYIQNPSVLVNQGAAGQTLGFGNLGRNVIIGPGFSNLDFALVKNTRLSERLNWEIRVEAFDLLNQANFTQPGSVVGTSTFGLITGGTRFPPGDSGSSRQLQVAMKLQF